MIIQNLSVWIFGTMIADLKNGDCLPIAISINLYHLEPVRGVKTYEVASLM